MPTFTRHLPAVCLHMQAPYRQAERMCSRGPWWRCSCRHLSSNSGRLNLLWEHCQQPRRGRIPGQSSHGSSLWRSAYFADGHSIFTLHRALDLADSPPEQHTPLEPGGCKLRTLYSFWTTACVGPSCTECLFLSNTARLYTPVQTNSTGDITTCTFLGNSALNGGGIYQNMASGSILRTAFTDNVAGQKGGAIFGETSMGNIMNSTFTTNKASQAGGAGKHACSL